MIARTKPKGLIHRCEIVKNFTCPKCKQAAISLTDKYRAGTWRVIRCPNCGARLCAQPWVLAVAYMIYMWAAAWFGFWAWLSHSFLPLLYLIPVWLGLDFLNVRFMPLVVMKAGGR